MESIYNYNKAVEYIESIPRFTKKNSLEHTRAFLDKLDVNRNRMKIIHVAGTNGKGSVCAMISNILVENNVETGLFTSPHLLRHNERIRINNINISDTEFLEIFLKVKEIVEKLGGIGYPHPSYFEFLFLMGMYEFHKVGVEYVILETGLGGRLDATNSIFNPVMTIITSVGMDHMEYLGDSIESIAGEKAGIIKENVPVIYWAENEKVRKKIEETADAKHAEKYPLIKSDYKIKIKTDKRVDFYVNSGYYLSYTFFIPFICEYQVQNALLALTAVSLIKDIRDNTDIIKKALSDVKWEGRMERVAPGVIFDGAHNGPGIDEFIKTFNEYQCKGKKIILFSVVKDKDREYMISGISDTDVSVIYTVGLRCERGLDYEVIKKDFKDKGCGAEVISVNDAEEAFRMALRNKSRDDVSFAVGSLYLIGELKGCMLKDEFKKLTLKDEIKY